MASTLNTLIGKASHDIFRRAAIKRRNTSDGKYESSWSDITPFIKSWGTFQSGIDDIRLNRFRHSGLTLKVRNDTGAFNPETDANSLWFGTLTRYKTLVRIQAGYKDEDDAELPTETTLGIYVMSEEIPRSAKSNDVVISCKSLVSVFDEVLADEIPGLGATQTASDIITKIRDHTDGSSNFIFREFITSTAWTIQTTTTNYNLATTTSGLEGITVWELMSRLAECEGFVLLINRTGGFEFRNRDPRTSTAAIEFRGQGFVNPNIISFNESKDAFDKYFNRFRLKWAEPDTSTSYVEAGSGTSVDPSSTAWKFGNRTYQFENLFFLTSTAAQTVVNNLKTTFEDVEEEVNITAKFIPHIEVLDRVSLSYRSYSLEGLTLWDTEDWASDTASAPDDGMNWASEEGENFDYNDKQFKVLSKNTNLDNMTTVFTLRAV